MHACGHDGHTAIGMGVATLLAGQRQRLPGRVKLVFQPAEEGLGGARAMLADGVLDAPTPAASFGLHLWSRLPLNQIRRAAGAALGRRGQGGSGGLRPGRARRHAPRDSGRDLHRQPDRGGVAGHHLPQRRSRRRRR
jgi:hypothetical protein